VDLEEELEDVAEGRLLRVEEDLDRLRVGAGVGLGRIGNVSAGPADARGDEAGALPEQLLDALEATAREDRGLGVVAHRVVLRRSSCED
jgi:hypothetical protein